MNKPLASIIITNYNYERFLKEAIDSALNQNYQPLEVIVVDDGSTDDSQQIITNYGEEIIPLLKENGGQGSAFNVGFAASRGEVVCFLDADDVLLPDAIARAVELLGDPNIVQVHWPLSAIDADGKPLGKLIPDRPLPEGDLREAHLQGSIESYVFSPTSGNAWSRSYLEKIFPLHDIYYSLNADAYLTFLSPFFGSIKRIAEYQALYRIHGDNGTSKLTYSWQLSQYHNHIKALCESLHKHDIQIEDAFERWKGSEYEFIQRLGALEPELTPLIPIGQGYILVDMNEWGSGQLLDKCQSIPFLEKDGMYWGAPKDDAIAIKEFERLYRKGASFIVFGWPAFWWFDYYAEFACYLRTKFRCVLDNERLVVFDLRMSV
ncbi:MAG: glycosyltransferase family 2 protein [Nostoc sp. DedQUE08]|uniref:glycosyltransferase family 2 protein n=1 Tax=unclassified Nostoc TaxID=2593658 RepID=UPI002AD580F3|nr:MULTISPECIES: glycosyltransferase family 2 protein [unclassified Nostoc]MDZ8064299.1 glycosyltransferase family 2 protein [Nostoc sp. DedQUE08]MDZ8093583.1 glycosyltransferase family 2 protein [Nostoc sp. DedQUE05]MDZ8135531.1 glycosyltransferase family 2 protein [Nostoc sp. DedQUE04]